MAKVSKLDVSRIATGKEGKEFILSILRDGKSLSRLLVPIVKANGSVYAFAPVGATKEELIKFTVSLLGGNLGSTNLLRETAIRAMADGLCDPSRIVVFENPIDTPATPSVIKNSRSRTVFKGDEVLNIAIFQDGKSGVQAAEYDAGYGVTEVAVLSSFSEPASLNSGAELTEEQLWEIASNAQAVFVRAYDDESYVIWTRHS